MTLEFQAQSTFPVSSQTLFSWHERPGAFERLSPPFAPAEVVAKTGTIRDGDRLTLKMKLGPFSRRWVAEHRDFEPGRQFRDVQVQGPFAAWDHLHRVDSDGPTTATLSDEIRLRLPLGALSEPLLGRMVRRELGRVFGYRHAVMRHDLTLHELAGARRLKVAVSGASGLIGSSLVALLESGGHEVSKLVRREGEGGILWDPRGGSIDAAALEGLDAVVHLAGETVAQPWTRAARGRIRASRIEGTALIAETLARLERPPEVFVSASAVGYYGDRDEPVDEKAQKGDGFLADVCDAWEAAAQPARAAGLRVAHPRFGVVLSPSGGALAKLRLPFSLGAGGVVGDGSQGMSWVSIDDAAGAIYFALLEPSIVGPFNVTGPEPVDNRAFTRALGRVMKRPTFIPLPSFAVKLAMGEMGQEMLLSGQRARPTRLEAAGYPFAHRTLEEALRHVLGE